MNEAAIDEELRELDMHGGRDVVVGERGHLRERCLRRKVKREWMIYGRVEE